MLAYNTIKTIWRPLSKRRHFLLYDVEEVLKCLGISRAHLTVLCIVSKNDYNNNLSLMGVITNYKVVKSLKEA
ncbi:hypothetical protein EDD11_008779, partial [Mortierella claussenii]